MEQEAQVLKRDETNKPEKDKDHRPEQRVEIFVNGRAVILRDDDQTGLSIKQAAIEQGIRIEIDFILSVERERGKTEIIGDNQKIKVRRHQKFTAIADDDNS